MQLLIDILSKEFGPNFEKNKEIRNMTTIKIGGNAEYLLTVRTESELVKAIDLLQPFGVPITLLGGGSNCIISTKGIAGVVIRNLSSGITIAGYKSKRINTIETSEVLVEVSSGTSMNAFVRHCCENAWSGVEMHLGLPGTVGGAVVMNSKWTKPIVGYVGDVVHSGKIITANGEIKNVLRDYFNFKYDYSKLQETGEILLSTIFLLQKKTSEAVWDIANKSLLYRKESQPQGVFSAGCTFQNITEAEARIAKTPNFTTSAGYLIDQCGLKGYTIGGAQVSLQHANFIVNLGNASSQDVIKLINHIKDSVQKKFQIKLTEEVKIIGL